MSRVVLVTGSEGFIGSHLTETLVRTGYRVRAFVQYNSLSSCGWIDTLSEDVRSEIEIVFGDVRDIDSVSRAVEGSACVIHLAALIGIPYSYIAPRSYLDVNILGTLNVMQSSIRHNVDRVVHTSTSEVYGSAQRVPIDERHPLRAQSPYAASKIAADQLVLSFVSTFNLPAIVLRPFNVFGPRQSLRAVIPSIITQLRTSNLVLRLGSIAPTRDFNYVFDTVSAFMSAITSPFGVGEVFNVGSGIEVSIEQVARLLMRIVGRDVEIQNDSARERPSNSEVSRLVADSELARTVLGWCPRWTGMEGLERALKETNAWYLEPRNHSQYQNNAFRL